MRPGSKRPSGCQRFRLEIDPGKKGLGMMQGRRSRQALGRLGEDLATDFLRREGYELVTRNWRHRSGEIDIVARDGDCWAFVEVKTRRGHRVQNPEDGLTDQKARKLQQLALTYLAEHGLANVSWRIDLVAIELDGQDRPVRMNLVPCAVVL